MRNFRTWSFFCFLLLLLVVGIQCKKKSDPPASSLPAATQEGKNSFGCKINGEDWIPYFRCTTFTGNCKELGFGVFYQNTISKIPLDFTLSARKTVGDSALSVFEMYTADSKIAKTGNVIDSVVILYFEGTNEFYHFPPVYSSGAVNLTKLDTVNNIIAGTFAFTLYNSSGDSVVVTDGRFDLTFNACLCQ